MELQNKIEELIDKNGSDFEVSKLIKQEYKLYLDSLDILFKEHKGKNFLVKHTKSIDSFLKIIYKYIIRKYFEDYTPLQNALPITLLALGSYAREQLCVYSDIDLMIVYKDIKGYNTKEIIESILSMAWDSGFKLGHRVHEVSDLIDASRTEHSIKTAMLESRFIYGSKFIWIQTQNSLAFIRKDNQTSFIETKLQEYYDRHDSKPIEMRADIKNGAGGFRDLNALYWIATSLYGVSKVRDLIPLIDERDYAKMMQSMEFLFKVRVALHLSSGKKEDTLRLELIPDIAKMLGLSQKRVAQKIYKSLYDVKTYSHIFITQLIKDILPLDFKNAQKIGDDLFIIDEKLYAKDVMPKKDTLTIIHSLIKHTKKIKYFNITFVVYIKNSKFKNQDNSQNHLIKDIFYQDRLYELFMAMYNAKLLLTVFPALSKVRNLPQFDGYHRYPVDIHSIQTLRALESIDDKNIRDIYENLDADEKAILRVASFLHDCGKGRKKDHSILGSSIVKKFSQSLEFDKKSTTYAYTLVRYHTLMSNIAAREDIYNEKVIYSFISKIKNPTTLKLLYILTYADIESVGEGTYSNFNSNLLYQLYNLSMDAFSHNAMISEAGKRENIEKKLKTSQGFLTLKNSTKKRILRIQSNLLFFKYTIPEINSLAIWIESMSSEYEYKISYENSLEIEILSKVELNVGYLLGKLSHLDIITMDIFKIEMNLKYFKIGFTESIDEDDLFTLDETIKKAFDMSSKTKLPPLDLSKKEIDINCMHSTSYARMKVNCIDQKGLVANIISTFDDMGIDIASAKIQTMRNRARNLFLIEKNGKFCSMKDEILKKLTTKGV
jgi:[protein-PII] uridylyltransferase